MAYTVVSLCCLMPFILLTKTCKTEIVNDDISLQTKVSILENLVKTILLDNAREREEFREVKNELLALKKSMVDTTKDVQMLKEKKRQTASVDDGIVQKRMLLPVISGRGQPGGIGFSVSLSHHLENLGIHQVVVFDNVITNYGSGYDSVSGVFKAPVSGLYFFNVVIMSHAAENIETQIVKNGTPIVSTYSGDSTTWNQGTQSTVLYLNSGDDVYVHIQDNKGINNGNIRIFGGHWTSFSGFLISV